MKRFTGFTIILLTFLSLFGGEYVIDDASLLTESERISLEAVLSSVSSGTGISTVVATACSTGGMDDTAYADSIIEMEKYGEDGVVFFLNMGERTYTISTTGYAMYVLDDKALENDSAYYGYLSRGDYYRAFEGWAKSVETYADYASRESYERSYPDSRGYWKEDGGKSFMWQMPLFFSVLIGAFISFFIISFQKRKLKNTGLRPNADDYVVPSSFNLTSSRDIFLYSNTVRIPHSNGPSSPPGGRHTTMHISQSGRSHGGRSGRF